MSASRSRRADAPKCTSRSPRLLRCEQLESRTVLAAISPLANLSVTLSPKRQPRRECQDADRHAADRGQGGQPPAVNSAGSPGTTTALSVLGSDAQGASSLVYNWTITSVPAGGSAKFSVNGSNAAKNDTVTFNEAGVYGITVTIVDGSGLSVTSSVKVTVVQTLTSISLYTGGSKALVNPSTPLKVTGTSQTLVAMAVDQFGNAMATQPTFTWSATAYPSGAKPSFTSGGGTETVTFSKAGSYGVNVSARRQRRSGLGLGQILVVAEPTTFTVSQVGGNAVITGTSAQFSRQPNPRPVPQPAAVDHHAHLDRHSVPGGAAPRNSLHSGSTTTVKFSAAGTYVLTATETDSSHNTVSQSSRCLVAQVPAGHYDGQSDHRHRHEPIIAGAGLRGPVRQADHRACRTGPGRPPPCSSAASAPTFATNNATTTATFSMAGIYVLKAQPSGSTAFVHRDRDRQADTDEHRRHARHRQPPGRRHAAIHGPGARPVPAGDGRAADVHLERQRRHDQLRRPLHGPQHGRHL